MGREGGRSAGDSMIAVEVRKRWLQKVVRVGFLATAELHSTPHQSLPI